MFSDVFSIPTEILIRVETKTQDGRTTWNTQSPANSLRCWCYILLTWASVLQVEEVPLAGAHTFICLKGSEPEVLCPALVFCQQTALMHRRSRWLFTLAVCIFLWTNLHETFRTQSPWRPLLFSLLYIPLLAWNVRRKGRGASLMCLPLAHKAQP